MISRIQNCKAQHKEAQKKYASQIIAPYFGHQASRSLPMGLKHDKLLQQRVAYEMKSHPLTRHMMQGRAYELECRAMETVQRIKDLHVDTYAIFMYHMRQFLRRDTTVYELLPVLANLFYDEASIAWSITYFIPEHAIDQWYMFLLALCDLDDLKDAIRESLKMYNVSDNEYPLFKFET